MEAHRSRSTPPPHPPAGAGLNPSSSGNAGHLLDREAPAGYRRDWTIRISQTKGTADGASVSALVFRLGEEWLSLPTPVLQEVVPGYTIRSIPHRRGGILLGLVNVRGELLLCVSLGQLLGAAPQNGDGKRGPAAADRLLVLQRKDLQLAFPVDEIQGVHRYRPDELLEAPATVARDGHGYTRGVFALNGHTVGCLDVEAVLGALEHNLS